MPRAGTGVGPTHRACRVASLGSHVHRHEGRPLSLQHVCGSRWGHTSGQGQHQANCKLTLPLKRKRYHCCCVQVRQQPPCHSDRGAMRSSLEERMSHPVCSSQRTVSCWVPLTGSAGHKSTWSFLPLSDTFLYARLTSVQV